MGLIVGTSVGMRVASTCIGAAEGQLVGAFELAVGCTKEDNYVRFM